MKPSRYSLSSRRCPPSFDPNSFKDPQYDLLTEIINQVNEEHGNNLTEEDRLDLSRLSKKLDDDPELKNL